jgi:hypothetical protein
MHRQAKRVAVDVPQLQHAPGPRAHVPCTYAPWMLRRVDTCCGCCLPTAISRAFHILGNIIYFTAYGNPGGLDFRNTMPCRHHWHPSDIPEIFFYAYGKSPTIVGDFQS